MNNLAKGRRGEDRAAAFLQEKGYAVIGRNYRHSGGEIDIVAEQGGVLVFLEVKTWDSYGEEDIAYAVNGAKMKKIIRTARYFLLHNRQYADSLIRFDLVFITGDCKEIKHIINAFSEDEAQWSR